ncbi:AaceriAGL273Cp [[Ashbya] aceris (nom. inval.)]|nr:AaceriAGL273Cp [[Ashbya] aceris (nom. inval.)]
MDNASTPTSKLGTPRQDSTKPPSVVSKQITDDDLYRTSTQYRLWSFRPDQLKQIREELNQRVAKMVHQKLEQYKDSHPELLEEERTALEQMAVPLTADEELKLVNFYAKKVRHFGNSLELPTEVTATAISFFRKFFLTNSVMELHPKNILWTTIFLACKSENYFLGIDSFSKATTRKDIILKYEYKLLESLKFTLMNHHPYKALHGFFLDIQSVLKGKVDLDYMGLIYTSAKKKITDALLTDAVYMYTPPQITLAVLAIEDEALITRYLELKFPEQATPEQKETKNNDTNAPDPSSAKNAPDKEEEAGTQKKVASETATPEADMGARQLSLARLKKIIEDCQAIISRKEPVTRDEVTKIDEKLHYCLNPALVLQRLKKKQSSVSLSPPEAKRQKLNET